MRECPFCKSPNVGISSRRIPDTCSIFWVECECGARGPISEYPEGATQYWNGTDIVTSEALTTAKQEPGQ